MAKTQFSDGLRNLALIRASGSTARVLNLALVFERFGSSGEFVASPMFRCQRLNRALILKHALRPHERVLFERPEPHTTKIVFPFSPTELGIGGASVMFGEKQFDAVFRKAVGESLDEDDYAADFELLCVLHEAPSFDPFLLREQLRRTGREPARCFFDISTADIARMLKFVAADIEPLTNLAFGATGRRAEKLSMRLSEKLMTDENAQLLDPLRETLRLGPAEYREGVFAWKGFLYYRWLLQEMAGRHDEFSASFKACPVISSDRGVRAEVDRQRRDVLRRTDLVLRRASAAMTEYGGAFAAFARGEANVFRGFLLEAPARFAPLGEAIGAVKHIHSFWDYRFPAQSAVKLEAEEAQEILQEFDKMLAGIELVREAEHEEVMLL
ncbi:MAG: hypothetical protein IV086_12055 [Hyphomonadaceae bacterium]|nr:MAG: hypothetical protein FD160_3701 [Caulobacteraceae bacterium]MBT9446424.1 hypothetical protein [Hyphomonadaceae bacterium]TPW05299.1 MAG: hypothetical protein FD124_2216 [Alphaproteobacteria bacterium]